MARPTTDVVWATTGGTQIEPSAGEKASGHVPGTRPPARKLNWLMGHIAAWQAFLRDDHDRLAAYIGGVDDGTQEWTYGVGDERARSVFISTRNLRWKTAADGTAPEWSLDGDPSASPTALSRIDYASASISLSEWLRTSQILTDVKIAIKPGAARSGSFRLLAGVWREVPDMTTATNNPVAQAIVGATKYDDATANKQFLSLASVLGTATINRQTGAYTLGIIAGSDGGSHAADAVYGVRLDFADPGPRNH